jgi:sugar porter (SP) family MFS transporter
MALEQLAIVLGVVFGFWTGFITRHMAGSASWRIPLALQFLPGISLCLGCFVLPPSPRLLVLHDRIDDARKTLAKLRLRTPDEAQEDPLIQLELLEMQINVALVRRKSKDGLSRDTWTTLFGREYVRRTLIGIMIMFFQQWSGINALLYYGPTLVESIGMRGDTVTLLVSGGIGIVQFLAVFPAIIFLDRWGRKPLLKGGSAIMAVSHFMIAILIHLFQDDWGSNTVAAWVAVFCMYIFTAAYGMSFGPIGWVLPSEVFPLSMRSKGVSLSTASNWTNNFLIGLITPPLMEMSSAYVYVPYSDIPPVIYCLRTSHSLAVQPLLFSRVPVSGPTCGLVTWCRRRRAFLSKKWMQSLVLQRVRKTASGQSSWNANLACMT